jgi:DSF synthase
MSATASAAEVTALHCSRQSQLETRLDIESGAYWALMAPKPRPCFNLQLLAELKDYVASIKASAGTVLADGFQHPISYGVLASSTPGIFNLGGDLALFRMLIQNQDRQSLLDYGTRCIDSLLEWHSNCGGMITSIAFRVRAHC